MESFTTIRDVNAFLMLIVKLYSEAIGPILSYKNYYYYINYIHFIIYYILLYIIYIIIIILININISCMGINIF